MLQHEVTALGYLQRHVSFVESGRARPSRELLAAWLEELDAPLVLRNEARLQAGYAPAYSAVPLHDPALAEANHALERLLCAHDPMPALVLDAGWNVLRLNRGARWLAATLVPPSRPATRRPLCAGGSRSARYLKSGRRRSLRGFTVGDATSPRRSPDFGHGPRGACRGREPRSTRIALEMLRPRTRPAPGEPLF